MNEIPFSLINEESIELNPDAYFRVKNYLEQLILNYSAPNKIGRKDFIFHEIMKVQKWINLNRENFE